jgi:serine/threonine-protein kinase
MVRPEIGTIVDNRFKIIHPLGQGGFSGAYMAEDLQTNEMVVLKIPDIQQLGDPAVYERFHREMDIGKLLNHPDLPSAIVFSEGSSPYLAFRYLEGESLAKLLHEKGKFPVSQAVDMVANLLDALDYCHRQGIYHRDLKPENLLLNQDGHLKVIDFGIAVMEGTPRVTWRGFSGLMGAPEYMAPEQIKGERGGAKSDIYAVGCLIYHLLSGNPPFTGDNPLTIMYQHMTANPKPLTAILPDLQPGIWAATRRALRRRKEERYNTAREMANDLRNPQNADLKWTHEPDPPMASVLPTKKTSWFVLGGAVLLGIILALWLVLLRH